MTRDEAVAQLRESERADFVTKLNLVETMRHAGIKEDAIERFIREQVMANSTRSLASTIEEGETTPRLPPRTEVLNALDIMYSEDSMDEEEQERS